MAHVETTANGKGTLVRVVWSRRGGKKEITTIGTAHSVEQVRLFELLARSLIEARSGVLPIDGFSEPPLVDGGGLVVEKTAARR